MAGTINFKFPLSKVTGGFPEGNKTSKAAIRENIKTLILTKKGERVINPDIGTNISVLAGELFNNVDKKSMEQRIFVEIENAIDKYLPIVKLISLSIQTSSENDKLRFNEILISMQYAPTNNTGSSDTVSFRIGSTTI
jgi:phage baseplate assembly protein W